MNKQLILMIAASLLVVAVGCRPDAPIPLNQRDLSTLVCQESDLGEDHGFMLLPRSGPGETFFDEAVVNYAGVNLHGGSPGYQSIHCEIILFSDAAVAHRAFARACDQGEPPLSHPDIGEEACSYGAGVVILYFRRGEALVAMLADSWGSGLLPLAQKVDGRLH